MTEIQGKSILVLVSARFELARVRVIGSQLYSLLIERFSLDCRKGLVLVLVLVLLRLWLASVFTLVLVLRQSSENRSNALNTIDQS